MDRTELGFKISYHIIGIVDKYFAANKKLGLDCSILNFQFSGYLLNRCTKFTILQGACKL